MEQPSEERTLPATKRKLREARKKGQVARSADFISGASFLLAIIYIFTVWPLVHNRIVQFIDFAGTVHRQPFTQALNDGLILFLYILVPAVIGFAIITVVAVLLGGMFSTFGPVFSVEPLKPKIERINPIEGFKRLFAVRSFTEILKAIVKVCILATIFWFLIRADVNSLFRIPYCGESCPGPVLLEMLTPLAIIAAIALFVIGLIDLLIQRALFLREMRMTHTELKQERKNQDGNPLIRKEFRRLRRRALTAPNVRLGMQHSSVAILGDNQIVGIRYVAGETPVPVVVAITTGDGVTDMAQAAYSMNIPVTRDSTAAAAMAQMHRPGDRVRREMFASMAEILVRYGIA